MINLSTSRRRRPVLARVSTYLRIFFIRPADNARESHGEGAITEYIYTQVPLGALNVARDKRHKRPLYVRPAIYQWIPLSASIIFVFGFFFHSSAALVRRTRGREQNVKCK